VKTENAKYRELYHKLNFTNVDKPYKLVRRIKKTLKIAIAFFLKDNTRSSAIRDGPRDAMCQTKFCQLLHNSVGTSGTTNSEQRQWSWRVTVDRRVINYVHRDTTRSTAVDIIHRLDRRRVLLITPSTRRGEIFSKSSVWGKVPEGSTLIFEMSEFPYEQLRIGQRKLTKKSALSV